VALVQRGSVLVSSIPDVSGAFGAGVALSDDGTILAVGAQYENLGKGAVYTYDLVGDVWTQRGSGLTASDGAQYDYFGGEVALSGDGLVLVVGAYGWEGGASGQGGVYIFDYTAGAWVQRGSVLTASDAAADDGFGGGVALSSDGLVLAVGASGWEGGASGQGGVYIFDYTGGAWVQRGSVLTASDAATLDGFGATVALSGDGATLAVAAVRWKSNAFTGRVYLFDYTSSWAERTNFSGDDSVGDDKFGTGVALSGTVLVVGANGWEGAVTNQGGVYTYDDTVYITAPTILTVGYPTESTIVAPTLLSVTATGSSVTAPTTLAVIDATHVPNWSARCLIDGVDVSARLVGAARVSFAEGAARLAEITILPTSGVIVPLDYVGKAITLDYVLVISGTDVPRRLFTGRIDTPEYDPDTTLLRLTCVDDVQNRVAALSKTVIDGLVGGKYTEAVQGAIDDNWDYAEALLTTVAGSLDAGPSGGLRLTPWELATTWATFGESDLLYQRMRLTQPQRSTMVNKVDIAYEYRYPRLRQRYTALGWSGTHIDMAPNGYQYPTQQDLMGAASGSGWTVTYSVFFPAPAAIPHSSGGFIYPDENAIDMAILYMTQRHSQTVSESYTLTVTAPESVTLNGELPHALRGALASEFDGGAWESALDLAPLMATGGDMDYAPDAPRADSDYAIETLLDQARVKILSTHRSARVGNAILCNPDLDTDKKVAISTAQVSAAGKVAGGAHVLDFDSGSAITEFEIAIFGAGGAGIITPDTLAAPTPPAEAAETEDWPAGIPPLFVNTYGVTPYTENLMGLLLDPPESILVENIPPDSSSQSYPNASYVAGGYPVTGFRVQMPGVDDADRNPLTKASSASYSIIVPTDTMTFTVP